MSRLEQLMSAIGSKRFEKMAQRRSNLSQGFQLPKLINIINIKRVADLNKEPHRQIGDATFQRIVEDIQNVNPFVFFPKPNGEIKEVERWDEYSDQPFDVISIEIKNCALSISRNTTYLDTYCLICVDKSPTDRYIIALIDLSHDEKEEPLLQSIFVTPGCPHWNFLSDLRETYMQKLHYERHTIVPSEHKWKVKRGSKKHVIKISEVVHVAPKSLVERIPTINNRPVVWTHSWRSRGHWRQLPIETKTKGKNRFGERNQIGRTWVTESIKGEGVFRQKKYEVKS